MKLYTQRRRHSDTPPSDTPDVPTLPLSYDIRQKSRFQATLQTGERIGIDLPRTGILRDGDLIATTEGEQVRIIAAMQAVMQVRANPSTDTAHFDLMRAAYHLGNRHVPLMLQADALYFEPDHVLAEMLVGLGVVVQRVEHPFEPETGAYAGHTGHHPHHHAHTGHHAHHHAHTGHHAQSTLAEEFHPQDLIQANFVFMK